MTASNLSIVMAPNLLYQTSISDDITNPPATPKLDFAESNLINDIIESLIVNVEFYFGNEEVDFFQDPPTLIGSKKLGAKAGGNILNSSIVRAGKNAGSLTVRESFTGDTSWINTSSSIQAQNSTINTRLVQDTNVNSSSVSYGNSNTPKHPVPTQRTPVPKPRGSKSGHGKSNPPPRPMERPKNIIDESANFNNSDLSPEKSGKSITKL